MKTTFLLDRCMIAWTPKGARYEKEYDTAGQVEVGPRPAPLTCSADSWAGRYKWAAAFETNRQTNIDLLFRELFKTLTTDSNLDPREVRKALSRIEGYANAVNRDNQDNRDETLSRLN